VADELGDDAPEPEEELGGDASRPVPDPLDRPWTHPSELSSFVPTPLPPRETRPREWVIGLGSALAGAVVAVLILVAFGALGSRERAAVPPPVVSIPDVPIDYLAANRAAAVVRPSIVRVQGAGEAIGSGVAVRSSRILTYAPLVAGAQQVTVTGTDGEPIPARVVGSDPETNLALLAVAEGAYPPAGFATNGDARPGDPVVGVGDGEPWWVGIDVVNERNVLAPGFPWIAGLLRTDIAPGPTSLGGALVDQNGQLLGVMVTAPGLPAATYAVPIDVARGVADQLDASGAVSHGWLGIVYGKNAEGAERGPTVGAVMSDGPAAKAGLRTGDVLQSVDSTRVYDQQDLAAETRRRNPGDAVRIMYWRQGELRDPVDVVLGSSNPATNALISMFNQGGLPG
jgi:serine protease DegQ